MICRLMSSYQFVLVAEDPVSLVYPQDMQGPSEPYHNPPNGEFQQFDTGSLDSPGTQTLEVSLLGLSQDFDCQISFKYIYPSFTSTTFQKIY